MVRAPCCEKMGLNRGPWTPEEDQVLVSHIERHGHGNWRALPRLAGLLRCGKSCRLRWVNYLRPDVKRGNFSKEEEDTIIHLHELLGNRWSAIAARLPGRTDNEIKNVWHTHLKKRVKPGPASHRTKKSARQDTAVDVESKPITLQKIEHSAAAATAYVGFEEYDSSDSMSPPQSCIDQLHDYNIDLRCTPILLDYSNATRETAAAAEYRDSSDKIFPDVMDESFWSEALSTQLDEYGSVASSLDSATMYGSTLPVVLDHAGQAGGCHFHTDASAGDDDDDGVDFWFRMFMQAGV